MATGLLYKSIVEKENISNLALEKKIGLPNGTVGRAIERNSAIKPTVLAKIAKALPHLDLNQMQIDLLASPPEPDTAQQKAPLVEEQGGQLSTDDWLERLDAALAAAVRAADAATRLADSIDGRLPKLEASSRAVQESVGELESRVAALNGVVVKHLGPLVDQNDGRRQIGVELHKAFLEDQERKKIGIHADVGMSHTGAG